MTEAAAATAQAAAQAAGARAHERCLGDDEPPQLGVVTYDDDDERDSHGSDDCAHRQRDVEGPVESRLAGRAGT